jgi:hypothetical protein
MRIIPASIAILAVVAGCGRGDHDHRPATDPAIAKLRVRVEYSRVTVEQQTEQPDETTTSYPSLSAAVDDDPTIFKTGRTTVQLTANSRGEQVVVRYTVQVGEEERLIFQQVLPRPASPRRLTVHGPATAALP